MKTAEPVLLVIAPSMFMATQVAKAWGIDAALAQGLRTVTKAYGLRGWSRGTPFITAFREDWAQATDEGQKLDMALDIKFRDGVLRVAQDEDIARVRGEI